MKILNLYSGIGGNRKLWCKQHQVTAVEINPEIANIYSAFFPMDKVIVGDAHKYLLKHIKEFDFIWSSPPCPTHSKMRIAGIKVKTHPHKLSYPDMALYQEIIFLKHFSNKNTKWTVENVQPYYEWLIKPTAIVGRHCFWTNFYIQQKGIKDEAESVAYVHKNDERFGFSIQGAPLESMGKHPEKPLTNLVNPEIGLYLLEQAQKGVKPLFNFTY